MKQASRFMPKYTHPKSESRIIIWAVMAVLGTGFILFVWNFPLLLLLIPVIAGWSYFENKRTKLKFEALAEERRELSICEFARSFDCYKTDTWVIRAVYEQIQEYVSYIDSPPAIKASDDLFKVLEIDDEDLDLDLVWEILQRTGRSTDSTESNPYYGKVRTVQDFVNFINSQPLIERT